MELALLGLAVVCLSQPAILIRLGRAPVEALGFWRLAIALVALVPIAWPRRAVWSSLPRSSLFRALGAGALFFAHLWTFVISAQTTSIAHCMTAFSTHPLWTGLGAWLILGERVTKRMLAAWTLAAAGVALLVSAKSGGVATLHGDLAGILSAVTFSAYVLTTRDLRKRLDNASFSVAAYTSAAALFLLSGIARHSELLHFSTQTWLALLGLAVVVTLGGHALFTHLMSTLDVHLLSCAKLLETPIASMIAWAAFGETLSARTLLAFALVAAAVALLALQRAPAPEVAAEADAA